MFFKDERRAPFDGPGGWSSGWILHGRQSRVRIRRQQGDRGCFGQESKEIPVFDLSKSSRESKFFRILL